MLQIFVRAVFASIRRRAGIPVSNRRARCGAVTFIQRFSDALNLDPHFHTLALDGIYVEGGRGGLVFRHVPPPSDAEVARVADRVRRSVARLLERRGLGPQADPDEADTLRHDEPLLAELYSASVSGRIAGGPRSGRRLARVGDAVDVDDAALAPARCCAALEAIQQPAVRQKRKPLCCYRGPTGITAQTFEPHPVMGRYGLSMHCS